MKKLETFILKHANTYIGLYILSFFAFVLSIFIAVILTILIF